MNIPQIQDLEPIEATTPEWQEILPFAEITTPSLPVNCLPDWLSEYCKQLSEATQAPVETAIMFSLPILSTCLQGKVEVSPTGADYWEPVPIWSLVALPPSSRKTPITKALRAPLAEWEKEQELRLRPLINEDESKRTINKKRLADLQQSAAKESDDTARKTILTDIARIQKELDEKPVKAPKLFTGDITAEELQNQLVKHDEKMSVLSDEGGIFEVMTGLYSDGRANIDVFLQSWSAAPARVNRGSREVTLDNPVLSFGLTIQPEVLADLCKGNKKRLRGIGALARFLYAIPQSNIGNRDVRLQKEIDPGIKATFDYNIKRLLDLNPEKPVRLVLDADAREIYYEFAEYVERRQGRDREYEEIQDWTGKIPGQALRLAALFSVAENWFSVNTIAKKHMENAACLCRLLIEHTKAAFSLMAIDPAIDDAKYTLNWLKKRAQSEVPKRELYKLGRFNRGTSDRLNAALDTLQRHGYIERQKSQTTRKPTEIIHVHPEVIAIDTVDKVGNF